MALLVSLLMEVECFYPAFFASTKCIFYYSLGLPHQSHNYMKIKEEIHIVKTKCLNRWKFISEPYEIL